MINSASKEFIDNNRLIEFVLILFKNKRNTLKEKNDDYYFK